MTEDSFNVKTFIALEGLRIICFDLKLRTTLFELHQLDEDHSACYRSVHFHQRLRVLDKNQPIVQFQYDMNLNAYE